MASKKPPKIKDNSIPVECPHCTKTLYVPLKDVPARALNDKEIQDLIKKHSPAQGTTEDHRHRSFDEFLDCPECRLWAEKTGKRYTFTETAPPAAEKSEPKKEPQATAAKPPIGSIFKVKESV